MKATPRLLADVWSESHHTGKVLTNTAWGAPLRKGRRGVSCMQCMHACEIMRSACSRRGSHGCDAEREHPVGRGGVHQLAQQPLDLVKFKERHTLHRDEGTQGVVTTSKYPLDSGRGESGQMAVDVMRKRDERKTLPCRRSPFSCADGH
jgi:hypothetical protein